MTQQLEFDLFANTATLAGRFLPTASLDAGYLEQEFQAEAVLDSTRVDEETLENVLPRPHSPESVVPTDTLQDVIDRARSSEDLTPGRRRDMISAIRTAARLLARSPEHVAAHLPHLRKALTAAGPAATADISRKRLANVKADLSAALKLFGSSPAKRRLGGDLSAEWQALSLACPTRQVRWRLARFARWCSEEGVTPAAADASALDRFIAEIDVSSLAIDPQRLRRQTITAWAQCARTVPNWPAQALGAPVPRAWAIPAGELPVTLVADTDAWVSRLAGHDLLAEEGPARPLRPATLRHHREQVRLAASALVRSGTPMAEIASLADITSAEAVRKSVRYLIDRYGGPSRTIYCLAICLKAIARHHVKRSEQELAILGDICRRLNDFPSGMTRKNRDRLRPFDERRWDLLVTLPQELMRRARTPGRKRREAARDARNAVAIEILLCAAPRIGNLANLRLGKHVLIESARSDRVQLVIDEDETKNRALLDMELPPESGRLLRLYVERFLPALARPGNDYLFPGRSGGAIERFSLGKQITAATLRATGCRVNPHLFRHLGAKRHLDAHPGEYGVVQRVMGHKSADTTTNVYCGLESAAAARHFDAGLLERRRAAEQRLGHRPRRR